MVRGLLVLGRGRCPQQSRAQLALKQTCQPTRRCLSNLGVACYGLSW